MASMDIGIDLGTASIIIYMRGKGILVKEPSVVAVNTNSGKVIAIGEEAYKMLGRTPDYIDAIRPLSNGVISNFEYTEHMIRNFLEKVFGKIGLVRPKVALCVPSAVTNVEARAVVDAAINAGARKVYLIEEPVAAAIGAGIDISLPMGNLIVDIGGGTTDVAVLSLGGIVLSNSIKIAGYVMDEEIVKFIRRKYNLIIGEKTAETIKMQIGNVYKPDPLLKMVVKGRHVVSGLPQKIEVASDEIYDALIEPAMNIVAAVQTVLEKTPPELSADVSQNGIIMTGGGSMLVGLSELIAQHTGITTRIADDPIDCVAIGTGRSFDFIDVLNDGFESPSTYGDSRTFDFIGTIKDNEPDDLTVYSNR